MTAYKSKFLAEIVDWDFDDFMDGSGRFIFQVVIFEDGDLLETLEVFTDDLTSLEYDLETYGLDDDDKDDIFFCIVEAIECEDEAQAKLEEIKKK